MKWGQTNIYVQIPNNPDRKRWKDREYAGGMFNGRYGFKKGRDGAGYCIEMDAAGGIEAGAWDGKAVPAASCPGCLVCVIGAGRFVGQAVREAAEGKNQHREITGVTKEELK